MRAPRRDACPTFDAWPWRACWHAMRLPGPQPRKRPPSLRQAPFPRPATWTPSRSARTATGPGSTRWPAVGRRSCNRIDWKASGPHPRSPRFPANGAISTPRWRPTVRSSSSAPTGLIMSAGGPSARRENVRRPRSRRVWQPPVASRSGRLGLGRARPLAGGRQRRHAYLLAQRRAGRKRLLPASRCRDANVPSDAVAASRLASTRRPVAVVIGPREADERDPAVAPDESFVVFGSRSCRPASPNSGSSSRFAPATNRATVDLGDGVNHDGAEGPHLGPDGRTVYFDSTATFAVDYPRTRTRTLQDPAARPPLGQRQQPSLVVVAGALDRCPCSLKPLADGPETAHSARGELLDSPP